MATISSPSREVSLVLSAELPLGMPPAPDIRLIALDDINPDPAYQRGEKSKVKRMAKHWDPDAAGLLVVSPVVGGNCPYNLLDGLQRYFAMRKRATQTHVWCEVVPCPDYVSQALLFVRRNDRTNMEATDLLRTKLEGQDPEAVSLRAVVHQSGFRLGRIDEASSLYPIYAIKALEEVYKRSNLGRTLDLICDTWFGPKADSETKRLATDGQLIKGLSMFLKRAAELPKDRGVFDLKRFRKVLKSRGPDVLLQESRRRHITRHADTPLVNVLRDLYNEKLTDDHPSYIAM